MRSDYGIGDKVLWKGMACEVVRLLPADRVDAYLVLRMPNGAETRARPDEVTVAEVKPRAKPAKRRRGR